MKNFKNLTKTQIGNTKTLSVGGGEWAIEVYDLEDNFIKEFLGSNGTRSPKDHLWGDYDNWLENLPE